MGCVMEGYVIEARLRNHTGKEVAHKVRALGLIPAIVYGRGIEPKPLVVDPKIVKKIILDSPRGANTPATLKVLPTNETYKVIIRDFQKDPVTRRLLHCDFFAVQEDQLVEVKVPLKFVGKSKGEEKGGRLDRHVREVKIRAKADDIPAFIEVDVTPLDFGQQIKLADLKTPKGVQLRYRYNVPVVSVRLGRGEKAAVAAEEEASEAS